MSCGVALLLVTQSKAHIPNAKNDLGVLNSPPPKRTPKWKDLDNLRNLFDYIAREKGFHPIAEKENWYGVSRKDIKSHKVGWDIIHTYGSISQAIMAAYPELTLDPSKFDSSLYAHLSIYLSTSYIY